MCARIVWVFDEAKGVWVQKVLPKHDPGWALDGIVIDALPESYYNIAPTYKVPTLRAHGDVVHFETLRWGIGGGPGIGHNARSEHITRIPLWRKHYGVHHAVVVCDGFYEWETIGSTKQPYYFHRADGQPMALAGLYKQTGPDQRYDEVTVITCDPNALVEPMHDRMPVILEDRDVLRWLRPDTQRTEVIDAMLDIPADDLLVAHPVSPEVNKVDNTYPELIEPYEIPGGRQQRLF